MTPDAFGMVDMGSMQKLKEAGKGADYVTYMHNQLVLMVAKGNPKDIKGIADLGRGVHEVSGNTGSPGSLCQIRLHQGLKRGA